MKIPNYTTTMWTYSVRIRNKLWDTEEDKMNSL